MAKEFPEINAFIRAGKNEGEIEQRLNIIHRAYAALALVRDRAVPCGEDGGMRFHAWKLSAFLGEAVGAEIPKTEEDLWSLLSEEEQAFAQEVALKIAMVWDLDPVDFSLVSTVDNNGIELFTIIYSADTGVDSFGDRARGFQSIRNWYGAKNFGCYRDGDFDYRGHVDVNGQEVDIQTGVTDETLVALAKHNPKIKEDVWRINHPKQTLSRGAPIAYLNNGKVDFGLLHPDSCNSTILLRPAAIVATRQRPSSD